MKKSILFINIVILLFSFNFSKIYADPWAIVANYYDCTIQTIDLATNTVYGPFFGAATLCQNSGGVLLDVVTTPDGKFALVSSFFDNKTYTIDITNPENPVLVGSIDVGFNAEDIAITPDGKYALITDGGSTNKIALIDIANTSLVTTRELTRGAQCVATNGQWVVVCNDDNNSIIYGRFDPTNIIDTENILSTGSDPINAEFSPDGKTLLVANYSDENISVYEVTDTGIIPKDLVSGLPGGEQSIVFSPDGSKAFVVSTDSSPDSISWLSVTGPGSVTVGGIGVANILSDISSGFLGVDVMGITPDAKYLLVGNPAIAWLENDEVSDNITLIDLNTFSVSQIPTQSDFPVGIAVFNKYKKPVPQQVPIFDPIGLIGMILLLGTLAFIRLRRYN